MLESKICNACGTHFPPSAGNPESCPICEDDRQYVPDNGQTWSTSTELIASHTVEIRRIEEGFYDLRMTPTFAIGQRAFLVCSTGGNVLWDCIPILDKATAKFITSKGGLKAIAFSHPHFYSNMNEWAEKFDCPIYIHESDERWIVSRSKKIELWLGTSKKLWDGIDLINIGGHFAGSSILNVPFVSAKGAILCGDTFVISPGKTHIAAMHSYPNKIPLPLKEIRRIEKAMQSIEFDSIYAWEASQTIVGDAKRVIDLSFSRYR